MCSLAIEFALVVCCLLVLACLACLVCMCVFLSARLAWSLGVALRCWMIVGFYSGELWQPKVIGQFVVCMYCHTLLNWFESVWIS